MKQREYYRQYNSGSAYRETPVERRTLTEVTSIDEMDAIMDRPSYYFDGEWLHVKQVGEYDRTGDNWNLSKVIMICTWCIFVIIPQN